MYYQFNFQLQNNSSIKLSCAVCLLSSQSLSPPVRVRSIWVTFIPRTQRVIYLYIAGLALSPHEIV